LDQQLELEELEQLRPKQQELLQERCHRRSCKEQLHNRYRIRKHRSMRSS